MTSLATSQTAIAIASSVVRIVAAKGIEKRVGTTHVLRGASLTVGEGETVAVTGPSGSGKSTLLAVLGVMTHWEAGTLELAGVTVHRPRSRTSRRLPVGIGLVPQMPMVLPGRSVLDNVVLARRMTGTLTRRDVDVARDLLLKVELGDLADRNVSVLSSGEMQRVAVARALFTSAPIVLADEPTGSLDRENSVRVIDALISNHGKACVIVATHDEHVASACRRVVRLVDGRVEEVPR